MLKISVWYIVTDSYDSVTLFMDLETRGVIQDFSVIYRDW